jgi:hypothetical protein
LNSDTALRPLRAWHSSNSLYRFVQQLRGLLRSTTDHTFRSDNKPIVFVQDFPSHPACGQHEARVGADQPADSEQIKPFQSRH